MFEIAINIKPNIYVYNLILFWCFEIKIAISFQIKLYQKTIIYENMRK